MHTEYHIYLARQRADEFHRAAAISRLVRRRPRRERLHCPRCVGVIARRVWALRGAPGLVP